MLRPQKENSRVSFNDILLNFGLRQAGKNCTISEISGLFVYVILKKSYFSSVSFLYFHIFCLHLGGENSYLSLRLFSIDVYAGKMPTKYMPKTKFKTNPFRFCPKFWEMIWVSVYKYLVCGFGPAHVMN